jgi:serine/threonine protein kinase/WD40 repeat protein
MSDEVRPSVRVGAMLGHYAIVRALGAGGMGEVYEARDTRLNRSVALKLIRQEVASDPVRRQRLEREARAAALLNHPNIVTLHSLEEHDGVLFLTMELIDGTTLRDAIPAAGFSIDRFVPMAIQAADALAAAHAVGVIHRDLKPANIMITREGVVKVLDFGLSKSEVDRTVASVKTDTLSTDGSLLGTAPYMAPEVIEGREADPRSDIFSLGIVLFEMVAGRRPFPGDSPLAVITAILRDRPPLASDVKSEVPHELARLIDRCLVKTPSARRQSAADLRADLEDLEKRHGSGELMQSTRSPSVSAGRRPATAARWFGRTAGVTAASLVFVVTGAAIRQYTLGSPQPPDRRLVQFSMDLPQGQVFFNGFNSNIAMSPDGAYVAFTPSAGTVSVRHISDLDVRPLEGSKVPGTDGAPLFSPDGRFLTFIQGNAILSSKRRFQKAALSGGGATTLADYDMFHGGDWAQDGLIYWTAQYPGGIVRMRDSGGEIEPVTTLDEQKAERSHRFARLLPDGQAIIYTVASGDIDSYDDARIELFDLRTKQKKTLLTGGTSAVYSSSGHIVYARAGKLLAAPFDLTRREVTGGSFEVLSGLLMSTNTGAANFALSRRGDLAYIPGAVEGGRRTLVWVDRDGKEEPLPLPPASYLYPRLSPDGRSLAVEIEGPNHDFYVYDFARSVMTKMTTDGESHDPVWSPDGKRLAFRSWLTGGMTMWMMPADRSAKPIRLNPTGKRESPVSFSPDGRFLAFDVKSSDTNDDAWVLPLEGSGPPLPVAQSRFGEGSAKFSPDGRWVAYSSDESGRAEVYVQAFPGPGPKVQISNSGGTDPIWRRAGGELYYHNRTDMMAVSYTSSSRFRASAPKRLWGWQYSAGNGASCGMPGVSSSNYDVTADGQRFLVVKEQAGAVDGTRAVVVLNWSDQLNSRATAATARASN